MKEFTQKYAIVQLFEDIAVGTEFSSNDWPLHSTVVDTFAVGWSVPEMIDELKAHVAQQPPFGTRVANDRTLGKQVHVSLLDKTLPLDALHSGLVELLSRAGLLLNDPQFALEGFLPHVTVQKHRRLSEGDTVMFDALSIIDFFPNNDPYQRRVVATLPFGDQ